MAGSALLPFRNPARRFFVIAATASAFDPQDLPDPRAGGAGTPPTCCHASLLIAPSVPSIRPHDIAVGSPALVAPLVVKRMEDAVQVSRP